MKRLPIVLTLAAWLSAGPAMAPASEPSARPNVILILADDLGWADITPQGSRFHETPNLARLAQRAVRFTQAYSASPLCSPTRASIMTGLYPARVGITAPVCHLPAVQLEKRLAPGNPRQRVLAADSLTRLESRYVTLPEILRRAGYATAHFGKWHLGHGAGYEPRDQGFDIDIPHTPRAAGPGGGYLAPWKFIDDPNIKADPGTHIDDWMSARAADFIREHKNRPFYVNYWAYSVHSPWNARRDLIEAFAKKVDPSSPQRNPLYAAMARSLDDAVGRILDAVDAAGIADRTVIVFTSDNGGWAYLPRATDPPGYDTVPATSNAPLRSGKASNYEGGTRVPCLVAWPGRVVGGTTSQALLSSVDLYPTLLEICGLGPDPAQPPDGVSQVPALLGKPGPRERVYCHFPHGSEAQAANIPGFLPASWVRQGDWKLIRFHAAREDGSDRLELYDLASDIGETNDVASRHPGRVAELARHLDAFLTTTKAVIPRPNPRYRGSAAAAMVPGWTSSGDADIRVEGESLVVEATGGDPFVVTRELPESGVGPFHLRFRMHSTCGGPGQIFWAGANEPFHRDRSVVFAPMHDGKSHAYEITLPTREMPRSLRIDPANAPGTARVAELRVLDASGRVVKTWNFASAPGRGGRRASPSSERVSPDP